MLSKNFYLQHQNASDLFTQRTKHYRIWVGIDRIIHLAARGLIFYGSEKEELKTQLLKMVDAKESKQLILLLQLLEVLSTAYEYKLVGSAGYVNTYHARDNERIDKVFKYLFDHFSEEIKLDDIANIANMNKQAFCRFFKSRTQKTLVEFANEIRIAQAIKLMSGKNTSIHSIAFECGYNSISNFNKFFKHITGQMPSAFRKQLQDPYQFHIIGHIINPLF